MVDINNAMGVIFDLDGVIVDTGEFHRLAWYDLAKKEGLHMTDKIFYDTFGMQNYLIIPMLTPQHLSTENIDCFSEWKEQRYRELIVGKLELLDGAKSLMDDLRNKGFLLAIGTSTPRVNLTLILDYLLLQDCFDAYVTGEDVSNSKPDPETFLKAAEKLSLPQNICTNVLQICPAAIFLFQVILSSF